MWNLLRKELLLLFSSAVPIFIVSMFLLISLLVLWVFPDTSYLTYGYASVDIMFSFISYLLIFIIPILSIAFFSKEIQTGTIEILQSLPYHWWAIIMAKFTAAMLLVLLLLVASLPMVMALSDLSINPWQDWSHIWGGMLAVLLISSCITALSILFSAITTQVVISFLLSVGIGFLLYKGMYFISTLDFWSSFTSYKLQQLGLAYHVESLSRGIIALDSVTYLLCLTLGLLILTVFILEKRISQ